MPRKLRVKEIELVEFRNGGKMVKISFADGSVAWIPPERLLRALGWDENGGNREAEPLERACGLLEGLSGKVGELVEENRRLREAITDLVNALLKVRA